MSLGMVVCLYGVTFFLPLAQVSEFARELITNGCVAETDSAL